jgi:hypothetical protein
MSADLPNGGNPFKIGDFAAHSEGFKDRALTREEAIRMFKDVLDKALQVNPHYLDELKGKDLACWCRLDEACHADVILRKLNSLT